MTRVKTTLSVFLILLMMLSAFSGISLNASADDQTDVAQGDVIVYPLADCYRAATYATMTVNGVSVPIMDTTTSFGETSLYDFANFAVSGTAEVKITVTEPITTYRISPTIKEIPATVEGNTLTFTFTGSEHLFVKINSYRDIVVAADNPETDIPESSGDNIYNITNEPYNADASGATMSTAAIQQAIDDATAAGGGIVYVPAGVFMFNENIVLKSNVHMYLEPGSVLQSTAAIDGYETFYHKNSLNGDGTWLLYTEYYSENIKVYGRGMIDGNGYQMKMNTGYLANIFMPMQCSGLVIEGVTFFNGNMWSLTPTRCDDVVIRDTKHFNENNNLRENDAIDIVESQNVLVEHVLAVSEDDTFSTKTWSKTETDIAPLWPGDEEVLDNVTFDGCTGWSRCTVFKVGDGNFQDQTNITFKNGYVYRCKHGLKLTHGYGSGICENVLFDNIFIEGYYPSKHYANEERWMSFYQTSKGQIRNVTVRNIRINKFGKDADRLVGNSAEFYYDGVTFENIYAPGSDTPATSLAEMNITDTNSHVHNITILPYADPGRAKHDNLALNKAVTAKSQNDLIAQNVTDGDETTRWSGGNNTDTTSWITVDLGEETTFNAVNLMWETAYGATYKIQSSNDGVNFTDLTTVNNDRSGWVYTEVPETTARYVRMQGVALGTKWAYSIYEFEVYLADDPEYPEFDYTDTYSGVKFAADAGIFPEQSSARAFALTFGDRYKQAIAAAGEYDDIAVYDAAVCYDGAALAPTGEMDISFPTFEDGEGEYALYFMNADGSAEELAFEQADGMLTTTVESNGVYVVALKRASEPTPPPVDPEPDPDPDPEPDPDPDPEPKPEPEYDLGDVDKSGVVDVADIMKLKGLIMADKWSDEELALGDMDDSGLLDVGDIITIKSVIMSE